MNELVLHGKVLDSVFFFFFIGRRAQGLYRCIILHLYSWLDYPTPIDKQLAKQFTWLYMLLRLNHYLGFFDIDLGVGVCFQLTTAPSHESASHERHHRHLARDYLKA